MANYEKSPDEGLTRLPTGQDATDERKHDKLLEGGAILGDIEEVEKYGYVTRG